MAVSVNILIAVKHR